MDQTDWIYLEFLNSTQTHDIFLKLEHLLKQITFRKFNIFTENFTIQSDEQQIKKIYYLQLDLSECEFSDNNLKVNECLSIIKTKQLGKLFLVDPVPIPISETVDDTFVENQQFELNQYELNEASFYLFKVFNKGTIHAMSNIQFKAKLRADVEIELIPFDKSIQTKYVVMSLISKFIYYYNFLHIGNTYLLKTNQKLDINFKESKSNDKVNAVVFFFSDNMLIIDQFSIGDQLKDTHSNLISKFNLNNSSTESNDSFKRKLTGTLINKRLKTNHSNHSNSLSLTNYYDVLIPNQEFALTLKLDTNDLITVYFDTKFSLYSFCILPGLTIDCSNLVKKAENVFKSNSINCSFNQEYNLLNSTPTNEAIIKNETIFDSLNNLNFTFNDLYSKLDDYKLDKKKLLFKNTNKLKILGQIVRIYDLTLRIKCSNCNLLANSCCCAQKMNKIELCATFLIDDHSSLIKLNYSNSNFDFKYHQSNLFAAIGDYLNTILLDYLNEIKLTNIPIQLNLNELSSDTCESDYFINLNNKIYNEIKQKISNSETDSTLKSNETTINSSINDLDHFYENNVKLDLHKTLYDYLINCFIEKYFIFHIEKNEIVSKNINKFSLFKLSQMNTNEQYKAILTVNCVEFFSVDKVFII